MGEFNTAKVHDNEVVKAVDIDYGFKSFIDNFGLGMKLIMEKDTNFIVGGNVKKSASGGMNLAIEPIYSYCKTPVTDIYQGCGNDELIDLVTAVNAGDKDRIDIVEVCGQLEAYDEQQRAVNDPETNIKTYPMLDVKQRAKVVARVKAGTAGSVKAPATTSGWVKIAEVKIPANSVEISAENIFPVTADTEGIDNTGWTNEKRATINIGRISEINSRFRKNHNQDGTHKDKVIHAANVDFGTGSTQVSGERMPKGGPAKTVGSSVLYPIDALSVVAEKLADEINSRNFKAVGSTQDGAGKYFIVKNPLKADVITFLTRAGESFSIGIEKSDEIYKWASYATRVSSTFSKIQKLYYDTDNNLVVYLNPYADLSMKSLNGLEYSFSSSETLPDGAKEIPILTLERDSTPKLDSGNLATSGGVYKADKELSDRIDAANSAVEDLRSETESSLDKKVDKESGKGLSSNDFSDAYKEKLDGIEAGAKATVVDSELNAESKNPVQNKAVAKAVNGISSDSNEVFSRFEYTAGVARVATTQNITLSGLQTIDGLSVEAGYLVLVKNQTDARQNGIYEANANAWNRDSKFVSFSGFKGKLFVVTAGGQKNKIFYTPQMSAVIGEEELNFLEYKKIYTQELADGAATIEKGGTGATTAKGGFINLAEGLTEPNGSVEDEECLPYRNTSGTNWGRYKFSALWTYIKSKILGDNGTFNRVWPVGSVYTQYPQQASPNELWGEFSTWEEIDYSGAFFRASGGNAEAFIEKTGVLSKQKDQNKAHSHGGSVADAGSHTHTRGTMDITGYIGDLDRWRGALTSLGGNAFYSSGVVLSSDGKSGDAGNIQAAKFQASRTWTGETSSNGQHAHTINSDGGTEARPMNYTVRVWKRTA